MERWQPVSMGSQKIWFPFGLFTGCIRGLWQREGCVEKNVGLKYVGERTWKGNKENKEPQTIGSF